MVSLKEEIAKNQPQMKKKKVLFHQGNGTMSQVDCNDGKLHELHFELLPQPRYSPDLVPSDFKLFTDLKMILQRKRFGSNEEVISETEAYFETRDTSFNKKDIELFEKSWNQCITLEEIMLMDKVEFWPKVAITEFILIPTH